MLSILMTVFDQTRLLLRNNLTLEEDSRIISIIEVRVELFIV